MKNSSGSFVLFFPCSAYEPVKIVSRKRQKEHQLAFNRVVNSGTEPSLLHELKFSKTVNKDKSTRIIISRRSRFRTTGYNVARLITIYSNSTTTAHEYRARELILDSAWQHGRI